MDGASQERMDSTQHQEGDRPQKGGMFKSLPKIVTNFTNRIRPKPKRNKTIDGVTHGTPKVLPTEPIPITNPKHNCGSAEADCIPGPSSSPSRVRNMVIDSHAAIRPERHFLSRDDSSSTYPSSRYGSSANGGSRSDCGTAVTTPDNDTVTCRPGVLPELSSWEERSARTYSPRGSDTTPNEAVRVHTQEVESHPPWDGDMETDRLLKTQSQPNPSPQMVTNKWYRYKPDKGKAKQRGYMPDVDGELTKKEKRKSFDPPPRPQTPPMTDPGYDDWREKSTKVRRKDMAVHQSQLSTYTLPNAAKHKQPPVLEPVGPNDEPVMDVGDDTPVSSKTRRIKSIFRKPKESSSDDAPSKRSAEATSPPAEREASDTDSSDTGFTMSESSDSNNILPRDSKRPSSSTRDFREYSGDLDACKQSPLADAARFEKCYHSKTKKHSHGSESDSQDTSRDGSISDDESEMLQMYRSRSHGDAPFELCASPQSMTDREGRLESISEV